MEKSRWIVVLALGALAVLLVACGLLLAASTLWRLHAQGGMMGGWCPWCGGSGALGGGGVAAILALLLIVLVGLGLVGLLVLGLVWLARGSRWA